MQFDPATIIKFAKQAVQVSDPDQRHAFIASACANQPDMIAAVQKAIAEAQSGSKPNAMADLFATRDQNSASLGAFAGKSDEQLPAKIGRYRIEKILGSGGFGKVYLARDEQLNRPVAVKVPHAGLVSRPNDAELYLAEARTVASLEHSNIVPVHDVGNSAEFPCFVVSRFVPGSDLGTHLKQTRLSYSESASLVATIAEALHYAHKRGIVHRDIKPGNILIDVDGKPYIVDFGLALREESIGKGARHVGTPAYMSPEQARGEGHRVDGRSDIFSLGVLFYEMLAGRRPFRADTQAEMFDQILTLEPRPLSQYDERIPKELQRICLKALSKRASDRFSSAHEMAEDLRHFLNSPESLSTAATARQTAGTAETAVPATPTHSDSAKSTKPSESDQPISDSQIVKIVPKGLRSFDAHDADFFLELLPGARDRNGLPDSLRFWKTRIEETDPDNTFSVGLIYGPSGCGKSSLVKAGLLPRLSGDVITVYIEATPEETETRLLHGLRKRCPALDDNLSLTATLAAMRRGPGIPVGKKVLIALDQFEQWLHAHKEEENTDLVQALRQCDGGRVQCIVMVRDDFWMAVTRFGMELEVDFLPGDNMAPVDLFPTRHAEKVLAAFGRAFGTLPDNIGETTKEQKEFIKQSVAGLAEEGKVICVRLALFAEMMKGKEWTLATLKEVGGTQGVGVTFLEEIFSAQTAVPRHRLHQKAARAVLKALLPDSGTDIKGTMRSYAELLEASGNGNRPKDFDDLVRILDSEIRLITPSDPDGMESVEGAGWRVEGNRRGLDKGGKDGGAKLQGTGGLAVRDGTGREMLPDNPELSEGGDVWVDKSDSSGGGIDPGQHRGGSREGAHERVPEFPEHGPGISNGGGNALDVEPTDRPLEPGRPESMPVTNRPNQPHAQWAPQGTGKASGEITLSTLHPSPSTRFYQLTHDYLVPSLRDWLTRKQRETRRGRAELRLQERAATWNARPEQRFLPSLWEYLNIRALTQRRNWSAGERTMMSRATRFHALRSTLAAMAMIGLLAVGMTVRSNIAQQQEVTRIEGLVGRLVDADPKQIPTIVAELESNPDLAAIVISPFLRREADSPDEKRSQLHARIASVGRDPSLAEPLLDEMLSGKITYLGPIRETLLPYTPQQREKLENLLRDSSADIDRRFRAALALAAYIPASETEFWTEQDLKLASRQLVSSNAEFQPLLRDLLQPIKRKLLDDLGSIFSDESATAAERVSAANALADYARDDVPRLLKLLSVANVEQYRILFPLLEGQTESATLQPLREIVVQQPKDNWDEAQRVALGRQRAGAAITLLKLGDRRAPLEALKAYTDMESISQFAARVKDRAISATDLMGLFDEVVRTRPPATGEDRKLADRMLYGLLITLGTYSLETLPKDRQAARIEQLLELYAKDPSSGVHGASGWLLRQWGQAKAVEKLDLKSVPYSPEREWFVMRFQPPLDGKFDLAAMPKAFSITFVVFPAGQYQIGSPISEKNRQNDETLVSVKLTRPLAIADREICWQQFSPHDGDKTRKAWSRQFNRNLTMSNPSFGVNWYEAVGYCRWLSQVLEMPETDQCYPDPEDLEKDADGNPRNWPLRLDRSGFRLPTEAEWEIACRGGMLTSYSFGSDRELLDRYGWYVDNSGAWSHPVGELPPDSRGMFDMHGNLYEWVHDFSGGDRGEDEDVIDPIGPERGSSRVGRGGGWSGGAAVCRSASRFTFAPSSRSNSYGFRLALSPSSQAPAERESGE